MPPISHPQQHSETIMLQTDLEREALQRALNLLAEHFDVAQIFVQVHRDGDETHGFEGGFGNYFARQMQIHRWHQEEVDGVHFRQSSEDDDDEETV
jgi:hypothetical protein